MLQWLLFLKHALLLRYFLIWGIFSATAFCNNGQRNPPIAPDIQRIIQAGRLRVAMIGFDFPPLVQYKDAAGPSGVDYTLAKGLADALGVKLELNTHYPTFEDAVYSVQTRESDIAIGALSVTLERARVVSFSSPYVNFRKALLINRFHLKKLQNSKLNNLKAIFGQHKVKIGVRLKSSYVNYAKKLFPTAELVTYQTWQELVEAVQKGEVFAAFQDEWLIKQTLLHDPNLTFILTSIILQGESDPIAISLNWQDKHLLKWVNTYLKVYNIQYDLNKIEAIYKNE